LRLIDNAAGIVDSCFFSLSLSLSLSIIQRIIFQQNEKKTFKKRFKVLFDRWGQLFCERHDAIQYTYYYMHFHNIKPVDVNDLALCTIDVHEEFIIFGAILLYSVCCVSCVLYQINVVSRWI
jgi:hypothetical protein